MSPVLKYKNKFVSLDVLRYQLSKRGAPNPALLRNLQHSLPVRVKYVHHSPPAPTVDYDCGSFLVTKYIAGSHVIMMRISGDASAFDTRHPTVSTSPVSVHPLDSAPPTVAAAAVSASHRPREESLEPPATWSDAVSPRVDKTRSALERRWMAFGVAAGTRWRYEPATFNVYCGKLYTPDVESEQDNGVVLTRWPMDGRIMAPGDP